MVSRQKLFFQENHTPFPTLEHITKSPPEQCLTPSPFLPLDLGYTLGFNRLPHPSQQWAASSQLRRMMNGHTLTTSPPTPTAAGTNRRAQGSHLREVGNPTELQWRSN